MGLFSCYGAANCGMFWWGVFSMFIFIYGIIKMWQRGDFDTIKKQVHEEQQRQQTKILDSLDKVGIKKKNGKEKKQPKRKI